MRPELGFSADFAGSFPEFSLTFSSVFRAMKSELDALSYQYSVFSAFQSSAELHASPQGCVLVATRAFLETCLNAKVSSRCLPVQLARFHRFETVSTCRFLFRQDNLGECSESPSFPSRLGYIYPDTSRFFFSCHVLEDSRILRDARCPDPFNTYSCCSCFYELILLVHHTGSLLPKCFLRSVLEIRCQVEGTYLVLCAAWPIHSQGVPDSVPNSMSSQIELKSLILPD